MKRLPASMPPLMPNATIAPGPFGRYFFARLVPLARLEARERDPLDLVARLEPLGDGLRVLRVALHAQAQRLEPLEEQERVERRDRGADVALVLQPGLEDVLRGPQRLGQLREHEAVVARVGLGEVRRSGRCAT